MSHRARSDAGRDQHDRGQQQHFVFDSRTLDAFTNGQKPPIGVGAGDGDFETNSVSAGEPEPPQSLDVKLVKSASKVKHLAAEMQMTEERKEALDDRNKWLERKMEDVRRQFIKRTSLSSGNNLKFRFFHIWIEISHTLHLEHELERRNASLGHVHEAAKSLGVRLEEERDHRQSCEEAHNSTYDEVRDVLGTNDELMLKVKQQETYIEFLERRLELASRYLIQGRDVADEVVEGVDSFSRQEVEWKSEIQKAQYVNSHHRVSDSTSRSASPTAARSQGHHHSHHQGHHAEGQGHHHSHHQGHHAEDHRQNGRGTTRTSTSPFGGHR